MSTLTLNRFLGRIPRLSKRLLPDGNATVAENVKLHSGELRGMRVPEVVHTFAADTRPRRIFRVKEPDNDTILWATSRNPEAELLKSPLLNDAHSRWYLFEKGRAPKITTYDAIALGSPAHELAVYPPTLAPTLALEEAASGTKQTEDRVYVISYVTEWGEETVTSPPATIECELGAEIRLSGLYSGGYTALAGRTYEKIRVYRTVVGQASTQLFRVADIAWGETEFLDDVPSSQIVFNSTAPTNNDAVPDGVYGARAHPSGALVAFKGRDVYFSKPYLPHAWPEEWRLSLPHEIVRLEILGQNIVVLTKGAPVILYGASVANLGMTVFTSPLPAVNYNSVVAAPEGIYYVSAEGLVLISQNGPQILSLGIASEEEWKRFFYATDYFAVRYGQQFVAVRPDGSGFIFSGESGGYTFETITGVGYDTGFLRDPYTGTVFAHSGDVVYEWDPEAGDEATYRWRSKDFYMPRPVNFATVTVELLEKPTEYAGTGLVRDTQRFVGPLDRKKEVVFRAWADGRLRCELAIGNRKQVNLPTGFEATVWAFEIEGQCRVYSVVLALSGKGQANG